MPFFVRPPLGTSTAKIAVIMSTIDYMAYANEHLAANAAGAELLVYRIPIMQAQNMFLAEHREYGGSIYDTHTDTSGFCLSSRLRPVLSFRPKYDHFLMQAPWQFPADLHLIDWLTEMQYDFDVITDEDISYDGLERIEGYNVLITGSHPEHKDANYLDTIHAYKERGGRFMYMGADGFYWIHTFHPAYGRGEVTEMRRCESGIRTWRADPGEYHHQSNGQLGGMWRYVGRYLHSVAGTGMSSGGLRYRSYYTRTPEVERPARVVGVRRHRLRRAPGRFRPGRRRRRRYRAGHRRHHAGLTAAHPARRHLGGPPHRRLPARDGGLRLQPAGLTGTEHPRVRADIAFHETPNGGACFAFSSIAYCGSLSHNNYDNNISRLTKNVLDRFMQDGPLPAAPAEAFMHRGRVAYDPEFNRGRIQALAEKAR